MTAPIKMAKRAAAGTLALAVCLTGGAIGAGAANAATGFKFDQRIEGETRFETAIEASKRAFPTGGAKADAIVIVNGDREVDGLTASYVAGVRNASILYVNASSMSAATKAEMERLGTKSVYIVGGTTVVSSSLESTMKADGYTVTRHGGEDRYETAALVARSNGSVKPGKVFIASGERLADALVVGPIAAAKDYPILLVRPTEVPTATSSALASLDVTTRIVVGGTTVVSNSVETNVKSTLRLSGATRQHTAIAVADEAIKSEGFTKNSVALVGSGNNNAADALVAAPFAAQKLVPLLFVDAGTETTTQDYLKAHSVDLTGVGYVFGGTSAVSSAAAEAATKAAAGSVTVSSGFTVVLKSATENKFTYSDASAKKSVEISYATGDSFTVDGVSASLSAFREALAPGDVVVITKDSTKTTFQLSNVTVSSGMVGDLNLSTGSETVKFLDPVTGLAISAAVSLTATNAEYKVNGNVTTKAELLANINVGDSLVVSGGDGSTAEKTRVFALSNVTVTGTVVTVGANTAGDATFFIKTSTGAPLGVYTADAVDAITLDGKTSTSADFKTALSAGDAVTFSRAVGKETITLTNAAPASVSGTVTSVDATNHVVFYYPATGTTIDKVTIASDYTYKVGGSVVTLAEFEQAATAGDEIVFQAADTSTNTTASIVLTDKSLSGKIKVKSHKADPNTVEVLFGETTAVLATVDTDLPLFTGNTSRTFYINDAQRSEAQFETELVAISGQSRTGALAVVDNGNVTEFRITSTVAAATLVEVGVAAATTATTTLPVTFNHPVYLSGTAAPTDFVITRTTSTTTAAGTTTATTTIGYVSASPTTLSAASTTVNLTIDSTTFTANDVVSVQLTEAGAAKFLDVDGKAPTPKTATKTL